MITFCVTLRLEPRENERMSAKYSIAIIIVPIGLCVGCPASPAPRRPAFMPDAPGSDRNDDACGDTMGWSIDRSQVATAKPRRRTRARQDSVEGAAREIHDHFLDTAAGRVSGPEGWGFAKTLVDADGR